MRTVPAELAKKYAKAGWWTQEVEELLMGLPGVADFPRTASGKIQKFVLRKSIAEGA
jgi:hypothetical protein